MEKSKYCEICKNNNCPHPGGVNDMEDIKPSCYVEFEMVEHERYYVPKELCSVDKLSGVEDVLPCSDSCTGECCSTCIATKVFNDYARLTNQLQKVYS